jgi:hypothetical protein
MARLVAADQFQLSLRPGRSGWNVTSPLPLGLVRLGLEAWTDRVLALHEPSGRYFVQPNKRYFNRVLSPVEFWSEFHDCPVRRERLRRLQPFLDRQQSAGQPLGWEYFLPLALRLEAILFTAQPEALWRHIGQDFDRLWDRVPLFSSVLEPWQVLVLNLLSHPVSTTIVLGKGNLQGVNA